MVTISICMIVKNEEQVLNRCLDSIADLAEEIIIVDTGSTDRTKEIASTYTDKIYDYVWKDDFADARNFSFSKATQEYIYCADADEVLDEENRKRFQNLKAVLLPEIDIVQMYYCNQLQHNTVYNFDKEYRPKLYKRNRQFVFEDPIHEKVRLEPVIFDSDIEILHCPQSLHAGRDFAGFQKMIKNGKYVSKRLHNMYAKELLIAGEEKDFLEAEGFFADAILDTNRTIDEIKEAACVLVHIARLKDDVKNILKYSLKDIVSEGSSEMCYELGEYFFGEKEYAEAAMWFYNAIYETQPILYEKYSRVYAREKLVQCYRMLGNEQAAAEEEQLLEGDKA